MISPHPFRLVFALAAVIATVPLRGQPSKETHTVSVLVHVVDPEGAAVANASVVLGLPRYSQGPDVMVKAQTDESGLAKMEGEALFDYTVVVTKTAYYRTSTARVQLATEEQVRRNEGKLQDIRLELRPIRKPVPLRWGGSFRGTFRISSGDGPAGFDFLVGDWVAPRGVGKIADIEFQVAGTYESRTSFDKTVVMRFPGSHNGLFATEYPAHFGSELKLPYEAPLGGYEAQRAWRRQVSTEKASNDFSDSRHYVFRIRTKLNTDGSIQCAIYGIMPEDLKFDVSADGTNVMFNYGFNPSGDRDIECDMAKSRRVGDAAERP